MAASRPARRDDFEIAIICALPLEYDAVSLLIDEYWDEDGDPYGKAAGDPNSYSTGRIGKHNVVLVLLHRMGKASAAAAAASIRLSYTGLRLAFLVGICGGVPRPGDGDVLLGDVVIGKRLVQYDFGRRYPDKFIPKHTADDGLGKADKEILSFLASFQTRHGLERLQEKAARFLNELQAKASGKKGPNHRYVFPGTATDKLFEPSYRHKHHISPTCICHNCNGAADPVCSDALDMSCEELRCDEVHLVPRSRLEKKQKQEREKDGAVQEPSIHMGAIASGDMVMKSGEERDRIAREEGIIAFEMEGAGVWEQLPCIVVKGVCDYSDSHKNKKWQSFAAATAASVTKAMIERHIASDRIPASPAKETPTRHWSVPFGRNGDFVGRESTLAWLLDKIAPNAVEDDCQRTAIEGLGGVGKTQIALEAAYQIRNKHPDCSVFWVPAINATTFENAYRGIGRELKLPGIEEDNANVQVRVKEALSRSDRPWLLIIDNFDDRDLVLGNNSSPGISRYLPFSRSGSILVTTRNHQVTAELDIMRKNIMTLEGMSQSEAIELLQQNLEESQVQDAESVRQLVDFLADLPLAIRQASAYMSKIGISVAKYLKHCHSSDQTLIKLLSSNFEDRGRYDASTNPVATTWLISFQHIERDNPSAAHYLHFICFLAEKDIPKAILPPSEDELEADEAVGILKAYAFITPRGDDSFDIHRLVRLAMQNWLGKSGKLAGGITNTAERVSTLLPYPNYQNKPLWLRYLPHLLALLEYQDYMPDTLAKFCILNSISEGYQQLGKYRDAERLRRQALKIVTQVQGARHRSTLFCTTLLARTLYHLHMLEESEAIHRQAVGMFTETFGRRDPDTLISMRELAITLNGLNRHNEAEVIHRQVLELATETLGREHIQTLSSRSCLAITLQYLEKHEEAESMYRQALELFTQALGINHPSTIICMSDLAYTLTKLERLEEAEAIYRQALELFTQALGIKHPYTIHCMAGLVNTLNKLERLEEAEAMHRQALELFTQALGIKNPDTIICLGNLAYTLTKLERLEEAEVMYRQALELFTQTLGIKHPETINCISGLANTLSKLERYEEAEAMDRQALELYTQTLGIEDTRTTDSMADLAHTLENLERYEEAAALRSKIADCSASI